MTNLESQAYMYSVSLVLCSLIQSFPKFSLTAGID